MSGMPTHSNVRNTRSKLLDSDKATTTMKFIGRLSMSQQLE
jgi:hypothetical protein